MAVDRGYGSGKPLSAAQSAARRVAADKAAGRKKTIKRQAANPGVRLGVSRVGKTENAGFNIGGRQYLETGVSTNKLAGVLQRMLQGDKYSLAQKLAVRSRIAAKVEGRTQSGNVNDVAMRNQSTSVFPRIGSSNVRTAPNRILEEQGRRRAPKSAKTTNLTELFKSRQRPYSLEGKYPKVSSAEEMAALQKASRGTRAGRGGINGIRAGQRRAE